MRSLNATLGILCVLLSLPVAAQNRIGTGTAAELYQEHCANCHGDRMEGGMSSSLIDGEWQFGSSDDDLFRAIAEGFPDNGMDAYADVLTPRQIRSLVIFIREQKELAERDDLLARTRPRAGKFSTGEHTFSLENVFTGSGILWGMDFLPGDGILVAQRDGILWHHRTGSDAVEISGTPEVWEVGQGGLMEVAVHPDYGTNGWIYLGYSHSPDGDRGMTMIVRGRIGDDGHWRDEETIYRVDEEFLLPTRHHFGTRIVFQDGYLFFAIGDRGRRGMARDVSRPNGKIHRIHDDGRIPGDNPYIGMAGALPTLWSIGHRNPQGLAIHPTTGALWETEHGPRGGDETNRIEPGRDYGWPTITYGMNYNGTPITEKTRQPGLVQPAHYWTPSIAVCGIGFYNGDRFPRWRNNLFVAGLASEELHRLVIEEGEVVHTEIVMKNQGRIRDVAAGPDGFLYVLLNSGSPRVGSVVRILPATNAK